MARLRIAPIVEGSGEKECVKTLLRDAWKSFIDGDSPEILTPLVKPRGQIVQRPQLRKFIAEASIFLASRTTPSLPGLVLVLLDADDDCPADLARDWWNGRRTWTRGSRSLAWSPIWSTRPGSPRRPSRS